MQVLLSAQLPEPLSGSYSSIASCEVYFGAQDLVHLIQSWAYATIRLKPNAIA